MIIKLNIGHSIPLNMVLILCAVVSYAGVETRQTITIDSSFHPLADSLIAVQEIPDYANSNNPAPVCLVIHGSGGLFKEGAVGDDCDTQANNLENNYAGLMDLFAQFGVASIAPASFVSRDLRFCEDNDDDYFQYVAPPFHNVGDGLPVRDSFYKMRRILTRTLDTYATINYICGLSEIDCNNMCMVGTSNGGSTIMSYVANDIGRHVKEYADISQQREFESNGAYQDRQTALANYPQLDAMIDTTLNSAEQPEFAYAISPGCGLRSLIPRVSPDDKDFDINTDANDLYYPNPITTLNIEIGTLDDVPDQCHDQGIRLLQASAYEVAENITESRYLLNFHQGHDHDLLGEVGSIIHQSIELSIIHHFYLIFKNSFDVE